MRVLAVFLLVVCVGQAGAVSPAFRGPRVVDANGKVLGTLFDVQGEFPNGTAIPHGGEVRVLRRDGQYVVLISIGLFNASILSFHSTLHYESEDCTGPPLVAGGGMIRDTVTFPDIEGQPVTKVAYASDPIGVRTIRSSTRWAGGVCSLEAPPLERLVGPMATIDLSDLTPPFRIR